MSLLMPDINLRRRRKSLEGFWARALSGENNDRSNHRPPHRQASDTVDSRPRRASRPRRGSDFAIEDPTTTASTLASAAAMQLHDDYFDDGASHPNDVSNPLITSTLGGGADTTAAPKDTRSISKNIKNNNHPDESTDAAGAEAPPPPSTSAPPRSTSAPPRSGRSVVNAHTRYVTRVQGPTLAVALDKIHQNQGEVTELDFSNLANKNKRLEAIGGILVARVLCSNRTVKRLIIRDHAIGDDGATAIAEMLRVNSTLEYIDLYSNDITDVGAEALAVALYGHESVTHLSLWSNQITNVGARALADALRCNRHLKYLGLVHNRITADGAQALLDALEINLHLETLNLATNRVPVAITSQIRMALARNRVEAPRLRSLMSKAESEVQERLAQLSTEDEPEDDDFEELYPDYGEDDTEASGFLSCSEEEDDDEALGEVWL